MNDFYKEKGGNYYSGLRYDIIKLIEGRGLKILEIGCAKGKTLLKLKEIGKAREIVGIDINKFSESRNLDNFIQGNIESIELPYKDYFDVIICADVLEHLINPWETLQKIKKYLIPGGKVIASIPNFRYFKNLYNIFIRGDFKYVDAGILDKTHFRFFCKKNIIELFVSTGFVIEKITFDISLAPKRSLFHSLTLGLFEEFLVHQYIIIGKK